MTRRLSTCLIQAGWKRDGKYSSGPQRNQVQFVRPEEDITNASDYAHEDFSFQQLLIASVRMSFLRKLDFLCKILKYNDFLPNCNHQTLMRTHYLCYKLYGNPMRIMRNYANQYQTQLFFSKASLTPTMITLVTLWSQWSLRIRQNMGSQIH